MINLCEPLLKLLKPTSILTLGNGLGREAYFLSKISDASILASDIGVDRLSEAKKYGYLTNFVESDIEKLLFSDSQFEISFVKESLHHLPRPLIGFYEMLRVASKGAIIIEPNDAQHLLTNYPGLENYYNDFESTRNYLYRLSLREIIKCATSLHLKYVIAKGFNDPWTPDFNYDNWKIERESLDYMGRMGTRQFDLMVIFIITDPNFEIEKNDRRNLERENFKIFDLPQLSIY
jgi:ubiquinone/menaquinone biosynthesis C-methylase UbiE